MKIIFLSIVATAFLFSTSDARYYRRCRHGTITYDRCGQRCKCVYGSLRQCTRVRKEFTTMGYFSRYRYIRAVRIASKDSKFKKAYDELITNHTILFRTGIHEKIHFLPWHRWFILEYENLLRRVDCRVTVPYWDWGMDSAHPWRGQYRDLWYPRWMAGFGGDGMPPNQCVKTGPFREGKWTLTPSTGKATCLQRRFNQKTPDTIAIMQLLMTPQDHFDEYEATLRIDFHDNVHCRIGGTMCTIHASNAPEFFLHHGFVDKIWADWQEKSPLHKTAYFPTVDETMPGTPYRPGRLIDLHKQPGGVRVMYQDTAKRKAMMNKYKGWSVKKLSHEPGRHDFSFFNNEATKLFKVKKPDMEMAKKMARKFSPPAESGDQPLEDMFN